ncbi:RNA polymerase factor sigma-54 [Lysinibacillus fusiformis]|uniref:RNA polymerase factor sigma-54 n=1 Tax=Lysinibacillus sp. PWR01 TaxID=3342384 RepID=UPI00372D594B
MNIEIHQRQEQKLIMTPQLQQSIKLLQYTTNELERFLYEQELDNPLIEIKPSSFQDQVNQTSSKSIIKKEDEIYNIQTENNQREELLVSANLSFKDEDLRIVKIIINNLDNNGYSSDPLKNISDDQHRYGIQLLQQIGPPGIGARNLKECLLLQCDENNKLLYQLVQEGLSILAERKYSELMKLLKVTKEQLILLIQELKELNPIPLVLSALNEVEFITPDILVFIKDEKLHFSLNDKLLPTINLNNQYMNIALTLSKPEQIYINNHYKQYKWLLDSLQQRRQTIIKIMTVVLQHQHQFFFKGMLYLKPLTLKDVAIEIDMHETTVSRAIRNKVIQTPVGTFFWKDLFSTKIESTKTEYSQSSILEMLKNIFATENKEKPLTDQKIAEELLNNYSINLARRTVSKYREILGIPPTNKRKEL